MMGSMTKSTVNNVAVNNLQPQSQAQNTINLQAQQQSSNSQSTISQVQSQPQSNLHLQAQQILASQNSQNAQQTHVLFNLIPNEPRDEYDDKLQRCYFLVQTIVKNSEKNEQQCYEYYSQNVYDDVMTGLLVCLLASSSSSAYSDDANSSPQQQQQSDSMKFYRDIIHVSRDNCVQFIQQLNWIIVEKFLKLRENCIKQILFTLNQLMKSNINGADSVCHNVLRQIAGGDTSPKNIKLAELTLDLLIENKHTWLYRQNHEVVGNNFMVSTVVYTYLRLIADHMAPALDKLRQKEIDFCIELIRDKFSDCLYIGRDFIRLLQNVARIPEFKKLWHDLQTQPRVLCPKFTGVAQIMSTRSPRRLLQSRLTPDMERKITYLATQVKFGQQKRYQDYFQKQYLSTPESQSLRCDLIRYICGVIHPCNEVLCSDIIPRWAIIGWLLTTCTTNVSASNAKLSLFYDWLFYDPERDNIMNIEPAILVMHHSVRSHQAITGALLDFLCRITPNFDPNLVDRVRQGIRNSLLQILEKRVLPSLSPLFDNPKLDPSLRAQIRESFPEFCSSNPIPGAILGNPAQIVASGPTGPNQGAISPVGHSVSPGAAVQIISGPPIAVQTAVLASGAGLIDSGTQNVSSNIQGFQGASSDTSKFTCQDDTSPEIVVLSPTLNVSNNTASNNFQIQDQSPPISPNPKNCRTPFGTSFISLGVANTAQQSESSNFNNCTNDPLDIWNISPQPTHNLSALKDSTKTAVATQLFTNQGQTSLVPSQDLKEQQQEDLQKEKKGQQHQQQQKDSSTSGHGALAPNEIVDSGGGETTLDLQKDEESNIDENFSSETLNKQHVIGESNTPGSYEQNSNSSEVKNAPVCEPPHFKWFTSGSIKKSTVRSPANNHANDDAQQSATLNNHFTAFRVMYPFLTAQFGNNTKGNGSAHNKLTQNVIKTTKFSQFFLNSLRILGIGNEASINKPTDDDQFAAAPLSVNQNETRCEAMEQMIRKILDEPSLWDRAFLTELARNIAKCIEFDFVHRIFPAQKDDEQQFARSISSPIFVLFKHLALKFEEQSELRAPLVTLTYELSEVFQGVGFLLLYFIKVSQVASGRLTIYKDFQKSRWPHCLVDDLQRAWQYDDNILFHLLPDIYTRFPNSALGNIDLFHLVVSSVYPSQLQHLISLILQGNLILFREDSLLTILETSLDWEYWQQNCTWQLLSAHKFKPEEILKLLPKLDYNCHSEAVSNLLLILNRQEPSSVILKFLMQRENCKQDPFVCSLIKTWLNKYKINDIAQLIGLQFDDSFTDLYKNKDKDIQRQSNAILEHLHQLQQQHQENHHKTIDSDESGKSSDKHPLSSSSKRHAAKVGKSRARSSGDGPAPSAPKIARTSSSSTGSGHNKK